MGGTRLYTVHEEGGVEGEVEFVREGFSILAFVFTFLWLWVQRAWLAGFAVLGVFALLALFQGSLGVPEYLFIAIQVVISMGIGIFGRDFQRAALARRGFTETGVATGESIEEAEMRYFGKRAGQLAAAPHIATPHIATPAIPA
ncbi:MAG: DUF2628 domain-containing protein [Sphingomonadales bacterium]